jgi:hypothetical protein
MRLEREALMKRMCVASIIIVISLVFLSCSSKNPSDSNEVTLTDEAQLMALWLSDEEFVPRDLALEIQNKLAILREQFSEEIPQVNNEFAYPAEPKIIGIALEADALEELRLGNYHEWDSLNQIYGVDSIKISSLYPYSVTLKFKRHINTLVVYQQYENLPGIQYAFPNYFGGDWSNIYPWMVEGRLVFLVRRAWGDCPMGCINNIIWYFKYDNTQFVLIGKVEDYDEIDIEYPAWWEEIKPAVCKYWFYSTEECEMWKHF